MTATLPLAARGPSAAEPLDPAALIVLAEILAAPSLPVASTDDRTDRRSTAVREAIDHLKSRRLLAPPERTTTRGARDPAGWAARLLAQVRGVDDEFGELLAPHLAIAADLAAQPPGAARNAVVGGLCRGEIHSRATGPVRLRWTDGRPTGPAEPLGRADVHFAVSGHPGWYDVVHVPDPGSGIVLLVPPHRGHRPAWRPDDVPFRDGPAGARPIVAGRRWVVELTAVTFHHTEILPAGCT